MTTNPTLALLYARTDARIRGCPHFVVLLPETRTIKSRSAYRVRYEMRLMDYELLYLVLPDGTTVNLPDDQREAYATAMDALPRDVARREAHAWLIRKLSRQKHWRARKAAQYPDDERNARSAETLRDLIACIADLPADSYPLCDVLDFIHSSGMAALDADTADYVARVGFDQPLSIDEATAADFLLDLEAMMRAGNS